MVTGQLGAGIILQNRYRIVGRLGKGGMGVVYLAHDLRLSGRQLAIKEFSPAYVVPAERAGAVSAFRREAQVLSRLSHPSLARVSDVFAQDGNLYLVMEYVVGKTLEDLLGSMPGRCLSVQQALDIVHQLCDVLEYLHSQQPPLIFRDLKPSNIMLTPEGGIKLIDFGIARLFKPGQTKDTQAMGTPGYAAPEQYGTGQSDSRTDIYGLGVVLHEMLTGHDPAITPFRLPPAESLNSTVPLPVSLTIRQATEHDPARRHSSVAHFRQALSLETPSSPPVVPQWLWAAIGGGGAVLALACIIFFLVLRPSPSPQTEVAPSEPTLTPTSISTRVPQTINEVVITAVVTNIPEPTVIDTPVPPTVASDTPTPTATATDTPTPTATATDTPSPTMTMTPTPQCPIAMSGAFTSLWQTYRERLGCPQGSPRQIDTAEQPFQNGHMFWRSDWDDIFVVYDGRGDVFSGDLLWRDDPWSEGMPTDSCTDNPPANLIRPIRGFGRVWCLELGASNARIGWALDGEQAFSDTWQDFDNGVIFVDSDGNNRRLAYVFFLWEGFFVREGY